MKKWNVVGVYGGMTGAEEAVRALDRGRFPIRQVSIIARNLETEKDVQGYVTADDIARAGAGTGAWLGGLFGLLLGATFISVPASGPLGVAGPLLAALLGGIEGVVTGAAGGALLAAMVGWGVSRGHILKYLETTTGGEYLVIAYGSAQEVSRARNILAGTGATTINVYAAASV
jgi:hypothetical protein